MKINMVLGALLFVAPLAFMANDAFADSENIAIKGYSCQKISSDESTASTRVRASDAAAYKAVEELPIIENYRAQFDPQTFAAKIYNLVDNHLEQLRTATLQQNDEEICIEINALLPVSSIKESFFLQTKTQAPEPTIEDNSFTIDLPPKPNIVVNEDIAYHESPSVKDDPAYVITKQATKKTSPQKEKTVVFVDRTEFFDGNSTTQFFEYLKRDLEQIDGITAMDTSDNPAYILKTKVLKAKVDRINSSTNRLQVVVSLSVTDTQSMETFTEHQNRFVLFNASENVQKTVSNLTRKLFASGLMKLTSHIKSHYSQPSGNSILTPRN